MRQNRLAVGILAFAGSASATRWTTVKSQWFTGAAVTTLPIGTTKTVTVGPNGNLILKGTIATKATKLQATGVTCSGTCVIENIAVAAPVEVEATATGALKFTGITLIEPEPATCGTPTENTTKALMATVGMREGQTGTTTKGPVQFLAADGSLTFTTVSITGETCSIKGVYKVTGVAYGDSVNNTGTSATTQELTFSEALQNELTLAGLTLKFGANNAYLEGKVKNILSPELTFQAHK